MFTFSDSANYQMPAHFGGREGQPLPQTYHDVTTIMVDYETDAEPLSMFLPGCFELLRPVVTIAYAMNRRVDWLAGGGYNVVGVNVPVRYSSGAERIDGAYALVLWENRTCPILGGREQTGIPKIFADILDCHQYGEEFFSSASYEGTTFLRLQFERGRPLDARELEALNQGSGRLNWFGWRYIPNIGRPGAALSHPTLYPIDIVTTEAWQGTGSVEWHEVTSQQNPVQSHIIGPLARLPMKRWRGSMLTRGRQVLRVDGARQLS